MPSVRTPGRPVCHRYASLCAVRPPVVRTCLAYLCVDSGVQYEDRCTSMPSVRPSVCQTVCRPSACRPTCLAYLCVDSGVQYEDR